jgi:hypothetical protein
MFHFFNPRNGPWVVAWFVTVAVLYALTLAWLFFWKGAEQLARHPALLHPSGHLQSPAAIRLVMTLGIAGGIVAMLVMIFTDIRVDAMR